MHLRLNCALLKPKPASYAHTTFMSATHSTKCQPFCFPVRVYWEDTDAGGVVFYANYLRYCERARTEWLRSIGINQGDLRQQTGGIFVVRSASIRYKIPARLDDMLTITACVHDLGKAGADFTQEIWRGGVRGALLAQVHVSTAWVDTHTMRPQRIPQAIWKRLQSA